MQNRWPRAGTLGVASLVALSAMSAAFAPRARAADASPPAPDPSGVLPIGQAVAEAVARYPALQAARARREATRRDVGEANAAWFPSVTLGGSATKYEEPMIVTPIHGFGPGVLPVFDDVLYQGSLTADWLLFDGGGREARIRQQRALYSAADADTRGGEAGLVGRTLNAYLRVLGFSSTLSAHDKRLAALRAEEDRVHRLADVGRAPEVDVRRAEAAVAAAQAERVRLASSLDVAERELARLTGRDAAAARADRLREVALADTTAPDRAALLARALDSSPDVTAAESRRRAADAAVRAGRAGRWPALRAVGNVQGYASNGEDLQTEWNAGLRIQVPLFTGGALSSRIGRAVAARDAARADADQARLGVEGALDAALAAASEARARIGSLAVAVARFEEVARIEKLRLDAEAGTQTDWLDAESELLVARAQLVDARHAEISACAEIARLTGDLDAAWIDHSLEAE